MGNKLSLPENRKFPGRSGAYFSLGWLCGSAFCVLNIYEFMSCFISGADVFPHFLDQKDSDLVWFLFIIINFSPFRASCFARTFMTYNNRNEITTQTHRQLLNYSFPATVLSVYRINQAKLSHRFYYESLNYSQILAWENYRNFKTPITESHRSPLLLCFIFVSQMKLSMRKSKSDRQKWRHRENLFWWWFLKKGEKVMKIQETWKANTRFFSQMSFFIFLSTWTTWNEKNLCQALEQENRYLMEK